MLKKKSFDSFEEKWFDYVLNNVSPWALVRETIFNEIISKVTTTNRPNTADKDISLSTRIFLVSKIIINTVFFLFQKKNSIKYLFINHPRKKKIDGSFVDIYTDPIINDISTDYAVLEGLFQLKHLKPSYQKNLIYADIFDFWPRLISLLWSPKFSKEELAPWKELEKEIYKEYGVHIDVVKKVRQEYVRCKISVWGLKRLLSKLRPKLIFEVVGYNRLNKHVNIAAKEMGIPTIELQHGHISEQHMAYNYPSGIDQVDSFPDYLALWGEYYRNQINVPIDSKNIFISGFKFFEPYRNSQTSLSDSTSEILFISQGTIGNKLGVLAKELSEQLSEGEEIIYKLHPGEVQDAKERYGYLYDLDNLKVDDQISSDLYERIAVSSIVIGVYSTALIEAASLGKHVIVVRLNGWEAMKELINNPEVMFSSCKPEVKKMLETIEEINGKKNDKNSTATNNLMSPYDSSFIKTVEQAIS